MIDKDPADAPLTQAERDALRSAAYHNRLTSKYAGLARRLADELDDENNGTAAAVIRRLLDLAFGPRGISDPPDMGKVRTAIEAELEEAAVAVEALGNETEKAARTDGDDWYASGIKQAAALLRARAKGISDPPDMG